MKDPIGAVEEALEEAGRRCLRLIVTRSLTVEQARKLSKWMFGCLNQRFTIRKRVEEYGVGELAKVLKFVSKTWDDLRQIDDQSKKPD
jgi:hypothetical protein